jgi:prepilin-type N-terminal cleavage/methylation domain-containing protein
MNKRAFTLVEIVLAITLLAIIMLPTSLILASYSRSVSYMDNMLLGAYLANREWSVENVIGFPNDKWYNNYMSYVYTLFCRFSYLLGPDGKAKGRWYRSQIDSYRKYPTDFPFSGWFVVSASTLCGPGSSNKGNSSSQASLFFLLGTARQNNKITISINAKTRRNITITGINIKTKQGVTNILTSVKVEFMQIPLAPPTLEYIDTAFPVTVTSDPIYIYPLS